MSKYELLLFDLDNTLIDFSKDQKLALKYAFESMGYKYTESVLKEYKKIDDIVWKELEIGEIQTVVDLYEKRCKMLFEKYNIKQTLDTFNKLLDKGYQKNGTPFANAENIIKKLNQKYKLGIITNGPKTQQYIRLQNAGISEYFSYIFVSEEVGYNKPNIKFFEYMFEKIEEKDKSKMLIIGDSLTSDIQGGKNCGLDTCWFNRESIDNATNIKPNYEIKKLGELVEILL